MPEFNLRYVDYESRVLASAPRSLGKKLTLATNKAGTAAIKLPRFGNIPKVPPNQHFYLLRLRKYFTSEH